jgi:hypothetical protein
VPSHGLNHRGFHHRAWRRHSMEAGRMVHPCRGYLGRFVRRWSLLRRTDESIADAMLGGRPPRSLVLTALALAALGSGFIGADWIADPSASVGTLHQEASSLGAGRRDAECRCSQSEAFMLETPGWAARAEARQDRRTRWRAPTASWATPEANDARLGNPRHEKVLVPSILPGDRDLRRDLYDMALASQRSPLHRREPDPP